MGPGGPLTPGVPWRPVGPRAPAEPEGPGGPVRDSPGGPAKGQRRYVSLKECRRSAHKLSDIIREASLNVTRVTRNGRTVI